MRRKRGEGGETCRGRGFGFYESAFVHRAFQGAAADNAELDSITEKITVRKKHDPRKSRESFRLRRVSTS